MQLTWKKLGESSIDKEESKKHELLLTKMFFDQVIAINGQNFTADFALRNESKNTTPSPM